MDRWGHTALQIAVDHNGGGVVKLLLDTPGTDLNATCNDGSTALLETVSCKHEEIVTLLLKQPGICVNQRGGYYGRNALHVAVGQYQGLGLVKLLLQHPGIEINATDNRRQH